MLGELLVLQRDVETAADLAALAGAQHVMEGEQEACAQARRIASLNNGVLTNCTSEASTVLVGVAQQVHDPTMRKLVSVVTATSKAGY